MAKVPKHYTREQLKNFIENSRTRSGRELKKVYDKKHSKKR